ncbi:Outer membrane efflux protein [Sulfurovum sp. enrichment culture clone C5]|uniref:Outer membrane efflux protein n=1 Tax=Sulfurovum sp. enrichment culture clone C5 TaxID=497650 RepID=A0A0S4XPX5_9BACT|nr:Outer membrane efflux protein [Sulfurovum sp. enrichment culture clone C5]
MKMGRYLIIVFFAFPLWGGEVNLELKEALNILKQKNLEIKIAQFDSEMKKIESKLPNAMRFGKIDVTLSAMRSDDAGNVFGFKLQSREATFGDFGAGEFNPADPNVLLIQPYDLNYPKARNHYLTKVAYQVPIFTGGKITAYSNIAHKLYEMSKIDKEKVVAQKVFETKKTFHDITLIENYITNLSSINNNINRLESIVKEMVKEGYAIQTDLLEVQAHKADAQSMLIQAKLNREVAYQYLSFLLSTEVESIKKVNEMASLNIPTKKEIETNSFDIQKALIGLEITEDAVWIQRASFFPTIGAFVEYGSADNVIFNDFSEKDFYTIGVQASWNIFNGFSDSLNLQKAKIENYKTIAQIEMAKSGTELKVKRLQSEALGSLEMVRSDEVRLKYASQIYENYLAKYKEGMIPIGDVLVKQSKELEVLLKLLTTKNNYNAKAFELDTIIKQGE